jgi:hypothetical protein
MQCFKPELDRAIGDALRCRTPPSQDRLSAWRDDLAEMVHDETLCSAELCPADLHTADLDELWRCAERAGRKQVWALAAAYVEDNVESQRGGAVLGMGFMAVYGLVLGLGLGAWLF